MKTPFPSNKIPDYESTHQLLANRNILVSGAGSGIGRTLSLICASQGATIILTGRSEEKLNHVYDEIMENNGHQPLIIPMDLLHFNEQQGLKLQNTLLEQFGRLDGLVNNAAILGEITSIEHYPDTIWDKVMNTNVNSAFKLTKYCLPLLKKSVDASIIFTTSSVGHLARAYWGAYAASKFATEGLAQVLAEELENISNIRVNLVNPGATRTPMRASAYPAEDPTQITSTLDIMNPYLFLLGPDSTGITGERLDAQAPRLPIKIKS